MNDENDGTPARGAQPHWPKAIGIPMAVLDLIKFVMLLFVILTGLALVTLAHAIYGELRRLRRHVLAPAAGRRVTSSVRTRKS